MSRKLLLSICTTGKRESLAAALRSLDGQEVPDGSELLVLLVDNSTNGAARAVFSEFQDTARHSMVYAHEPEPGIANARNRVLAEALAQDASLIGFLDDDETAENGWLRGHLAALAEFKADVSYGPVVAVYQTPKPSWLPEPKVQKHAEGCALSAASTNNVMLCTRLISEDGLSLSFSRDFNDFGEDTDFFTRAHDRGVKIVWTNRAIVREVVAPERMTQPWQLDRTWLVANTNVRINSKRRGQMATIRRYAPKALSRFVAGLFFICLGNLAGPLDTEMSQRVLFKGRKSLSWSRGAAAAFLRT